MLKKKFSKNKFSDVQIKPHVKISMDSEELSKITVEFSENTDPHQFGGMLAMIGKGLVENPLVDSVIEHGESIGESELTMKILGEMESFKEEIDAMIEDSLRDDDIPEDIINIYPVSPAWGNPEMTELFDKTRKEILPKQIRWHYLENDSDAELDEGDSDDTPEESNGPGLYMMPGMQGFISESQFQRLQKSQGPNQQLPEYEMRAGFTNFNITLPIYIDIANTNGVEYVKIFGRYTVIIAIGHMFDFRDVYREIEEKLGIQRIIK